MGYKGKAVLVTVSTVDGMVLDQFALTHYRNDTAVSVAGCDTELVGIQTSNAFTLERLAKHIDVTIADGGSL